jgi:co-chaperonin GroES (HSP10)
MSAAIEAICTSSDVSIDNLPQPQGYHILVKMRKVSEKIGKSGLYIPESRKADEDMASPLAEVVLMGPECFLDAKVFPSGPRCKVGDTVLMAPYAGQRVLVGTAVDAQEYRVITDAVITCVVPNPDLVRRNL